MHALMVVITLVSSMIEECPDNIKDEIKNQGIILTGGLSNLTGVKEFFKTVLDLEVTVAESPEFTNITGLNILLNNKELLNKII